MIKYKTFKKEDLNSFFDKCKTSHLIAFVDLSSDKRGEYFRKLGLAYIPYGFKYKDERKYVMEKILQSGYNKYIVDSLTDYSVDARSVGKCVLVPEVYSSEIHKILYCCDDTRVVDYHSVVIGDPHMFHMEIINIGGVVINPLETLVNKEMSF